MELEAKLFCLLLFVGLHFCRTQIQLRHKDAVCIYAALGVLFSALRVWPMNAFADTLTLLLSWMFYVTAMVFWLRGLLRGNNILPPLLKNVITALGFFIFAVTVIICIAIDFNTPAYILALAILGDLVVDLYNKVRMDSLTKLYNRYGMDAELREQLRQYKRTYEDSFYIIACDLDNFKHINDTWGHLEGDRALVLIAGVLSKVAKRFRSNVFRIGGDEFVIITDKSEQGLAEQVMDAIKNALDKIEFRDDFDIKMSLGYALYDGVTPIDELLGNADKKLYEAKKHKND